ncbi:hypothetical protein GYMLUDRAFT_607079 [Collybiopsis luxurians FD-317 M1]|uniref:Uncharacterized protein n=1 Tax=Collybiopsis luxurians FD-317 M1 TaxID=944289 RepID=A0A0D0CNQ7_9AGAR|nr:hypothetical protein GYMLUDRAFT_607079 [Collybiopsis luxurians FD-317 M1]
MLLPEDPFKLENPFPVHTYDNKIKNASTQPAIPSPKSQKQLEAPDPLTRLNFYESVLPNLLPPPPLPVASSSHIPAATDSRSSSSLYSESTARESNASTYSFPSHPAPPLAHAPRPGSNAVTPMNMIGTHPPSSFTSPLASPSTLPRGRTQSSGSTHVRRPSSFRTRSMSRSRSASISSPPTGPLPDPPEEAPSTPNAVTDFRAPPVMANIRSQPVPSIVLSGPAASIPPTVSPAASVVESNLLSSRSRSQRREKRVPENTYLNGVGQAF